MESAVLTTIGRARARSESPSTPDRGLGGSACFFTSEADYPEARSEFLYLFCLCAADAQQFEESFSGGSVLTILHNSACLCLGEQ